jgi:hypothetical protein
VTRVGWNAGLGARFTMVGVRWFTEARYHRVRMPDASARYIPVTIGLRFRRARAQGTASIAMLVQPPSGLPS